MGRARGDDRLHRRRRSVLQTPAFVDRMDLPDDAEGRVAIFALDEEGDAAAVEGRPPSRGGAVHGVLERLGAALDAPYAGVVIAAVLALVLMLGLVFLRR